MAEPLPKHVLDSAVSPTKIVQQTFEVTRRGYEQHQVQDYLRAVSEALQDAQRREADMRSRLGKAVRRAEQAEANLRDTEHQSDTGDLTRQIGDEVTSVLDAAHAAGEQRIAAAEKSAEQLMANAKIEATQIRGAAETIMDERRAEADAAAGEIIGEAKQAAALLRAEADAEAKAMKTNAVERIAHIRDECDALVSEAEEARMQILEDMERRRRQARAQVERLRVGRDRLLRSYDVVRRTLDEATVELKLSLKEAKVRGDTAARSVAAEPLAGRAQLQAELADAKLIGRVLPTEKPRLVSNALPRPLTPPEVPNIDLRTVDAPTPKKPAVAPLSPSPATPSVAPVIKQATTQAPDVVDDDELDAQDLPPDIDADVDAPDPADEPLDPELAALTDDDLNVVEPCDEVEEVTALAETATVEEEVTALAETATVEEEVTAIAETATVEEVAAVAGVVRVEVVDDVGEAAASAEPDVSVEVVDDVGEAAALAEPDVSTEVVDDVGEAAASAEPDVSVEVVDDVGEAAAPAEPERAGGLFAALRAQADTPASDVAEGPATADNTPASDIAEEPATAQAADTPSDDDVPEPVVDAAEIADDTEVSEPALTEPESAAVEPEDIVDIAALRDEVIATSANHLEKRLRRALADEQNELLSALRAPTKKGRKQAEPVTLVDTVGDIDRQLALYVTAITDAAATAFMAGAALVDGQVSDSELPAGAVEELLVAHVVQPIRVRLEELDAIEVEAPEMHVDSVRAFYRQRKTDHLGDAARSLAHLLCVAGVCESLPADAPLPWT